MKRQLQSNVLPLISLLMMIVLLFNSVLLARTAGYIQFPGEMSRIDIARQGARIVIENYEKQAQDAGVIEHQAVREVLAQFKFDIERASTAEEVAGLMASYGRKMEDVITREREAKCRETVLTLVNQDPRLSGFRGQATITVDKNQEGKVEIRDETGFLTQETKDKIASLELLDSSWSMIELTVNNGTAQLVTSRTLLDRLRMYENELSSLRSKLQDLSAQAGYGELTGSGIVVSLYDSTEGFSSVDIVHDRDVRDVVNELFSAGAAGISVGGNRLIATSSIRCAGPIILVNQQPIAVDPIVIKAVGDPQILSSSLELIKAELEEFGIRVEVEQVQQVTLPPYKTKK